MRNYLKYLLLTGAIAGCTIETVEKSESGGASSTGGTKATGGASTATGGKSAAASGGSTSSSVGGVTGTSIGGSAATGGVSSVGGTAAAGGSTAATGGSTAATGGITAATGGGTATGGNTSTVSTGTSIPVGGATATGGSAGVGGSTTITTGGASTVGGTSAGVGGTTAANTSQPDASTSLPTIKLDPGSTCDIVAPTTWSRAVYDTTDCVVVTVSNALTIEAGSILKFVPGGYLEVSNTGTLKAVGTDEEPIIFTSIKDDAHGGDTGVDGVTAPSKGDWGCSGACGDMDLAGNSSQLDYVQFLYGMNGLWVQGASIKVTNSTFAHHSGYGAVLDGRFNVGSTTLTGNAFFDNDGFPLSLGEFVSLDASNLFHDPANAAVKNVKQCIELKSSSLDTAVSLGVTELAFYGSFAIDSALTVANGVCFKTDMDGEIDLNVAGSIVNGANAIFTSPKDDSVGGDCTGDGSTSPADADWAGIWVTTSATSDWALPTANIRYSDQLNNPGVLPLH